MSFINFKVSLLFRFVFFELIFNTSLPVFECPFIFLPPPRLCTFLHRIRKRFPILKLKTCMFTVLHLRIELRLSFKKHSRIRLMIIFLCHLFFAPSFPFTPTLSPLLYSIDCQKGIQNLKRGIVR